MNTGTVPRFPVYSEL